MAFSTIFGAWIAAFLTLGILSYLYRDNPFYKIAEHVFVGVSAAYWAATFYWTQIYPNLFGRLFPKDFNKPIYSIEIFETARIKLLHRVKISNGEGMCGYDEEGTEFTTFKILLDGIYESVEVDPGTIGNKENKYQINTTKNVISSHRFNSIYFLYNWLLSLNPRGSYDNNWQIFAYGITEYDDTMTYVDTFIDQTGTGNVDACKSYTKF